MNSPIDRQRASILMKQYDLAALVLCEPEAFTYVIGAWPGPASLFRRAGATFVIVPKNPDTPIGAVVADFDFGRLTAAAPDVSFRTHLAWIETIVLESSLDNESVEERTETAIANLDRPPDFARPATFDVELSVTQLKALLADLGVDRGKLGFDLDFVPAADFEIIRGLLTDFPIGNGSPVVGRLRAIKNAREIALLRRGIEFSENGFRHLSTNSEPGMRQTDLIDVYRTGVKESARNFDHAVSTLEYMSLGVRPKPRTGPAERGDPLKADMICIVDGYQSDMSRNFVFGPPSADQSRLHEIAEKAFQTGFETLHPGNTLAEVHRATSARLAQLGLPSYRRGHFGHGVGLSVFSEQWPFIAANSDVEIEPNMVLAFEIPLYVEGVASYNLEEQILITPDGPQSMNTIARELGVIT